MPDPASANHHSPFAPTRWSLVAQARGSRERQTALKALGDFYTTYWYPLYAFARRKGWREEDARDQTQIFFQRMMEEDLLGNANPERGRLRTFLLMSFQSQLSHAAESAAAKKRGGGLEIISLEMETAEGRYQVDALDPAATPEMVFDQTWAAMMIQAAVDRLGAGMETREFALLRPFVLQVADAETSSAQVATALGLAEDNVRQRISRLRKRLPQALREVVRESLPNPTPEAVDDEIASLRAALRSTVSAPKE